MSHEYVLWIAVAAYGLHILEEYELNWRDWAKAILGLPVDWESFYIVNALVVVLERAANLWAGGSRGFLCPFPR